MAKKAKNKQLKMLSPLILFGLLVAVLGFVIGGGKIIFSNRAAPRTPECYRYPCPTKSVQNTYPVNIGFMGDLSIGRYVNKSAYDRKSWELFDDKRTRAFLKSNSLNVANLESTIIGKNAQGVLQCPLSGSGNLMILCGTPEFVSIFAKYNFIFNLANNHIEDFESIDGKQRTMDELSKYSIPYYYSHSPNTEFVQKRLSNISFGFLGLDFKNHYSFNQISLEKTVDLINKYNSRVDWLILSVHWGEEYATMPSETQKQYAKAFIDAGADVIHGHHSHVLQPYEWYKNKIIFYSLGNFVFDQDYRVNTRTSAVYKLTFNKDRIKKITEYKTEIPKDGKVKINSSSVVYEDKSSKGNTEKQKLP